VLYLKVRRLGAEEARRRLLADGVFDSRRVVERDGDYVYFPVSSEADVRGCALVEREGRVVDGRPRSLREALSGVLGGEELARLQSSFSVVGDIAVLELDETLLPKGRIIGEALLKTFGNIRVAALKTSEVSGEYRVPGIEVLAGENRTETVHREHGCVYKLDVARAYFTPRLGSERMRVVRQIRDGERVLVMFAGVGPYAVLAAKKAKADVTAVELNPVAVGYMRWNVLRNRVKVDVVEGDVREVTPRLGVFDRIIMPLPKRADTYMDAAVPALREGGVIHYYTFAGSPPEATGSLVEALGGLDRRPEVLQAVVCGSYSPSIKRICVDFRVA